MTADDVLRKFGFPTFTSAGADAVIQRMAARIAADAAELARVRGLLSAITNAVTNEGPVPAYHRYVIDKQRKEWPTLWKAIDAAASGTLASDPQGRALPEPEQTSE